MADAAGRPPSRRARLRLVTGTLLGALALSLAIRGTDYTALWLGVAAAHPAWNLAALAPVVLTIAAGVVRWRVLLGPVPAWRPLVDGVIIGQMLNVVLPTRLGEVARAYIVSRAGSMPAARVLTTIAVEKLGDLVAAAAGLAALQSRTRSVEFWLLPIGILLLAASTNHLLFLAFDLRLPAVAAITLLLALQVGTTLVSVPGNLGVFHFVIILVLTAHGVDRTTALGYAMVLHAVAILPKVAIGGILLAVDYRWVIGRGGVQA